MARAKKNNGTESEAISAKLCGQVKKLRAKHRWTLEQLSAASGVSRSMLSQIERNKANPTLGVAFRIAQAFGLTLNALVDQPDKGPAIDIVRGDARSNLFRADYDCRIRTLSPLHLEKDVEVYELLLFPGKALRSAAHFAGTREMLTVHQGAVRVTSGNDSCELKAGDSASYAADVAHAIENTGRTNAVTTLIDIYRKE